MSLAHFVLEQQANPIQWEVVKEKGDALSADGAEPKVLEYRARRLRGFSDFSQPSRTFLQSQSREVCYIVLSSTSLAGRRYVICGTMSSLVIKTFHTIGFAIYAYAIYYSELHLDIPQKSSRKIFGRYKYLTHWNLVLQGFMFTLCCFIDFAPIRDKRTLLKWRDHLFLSLSLPTCIFVATLFWSLYFYNRELIFPVVLERFYPGWLNHTSWAAVVILLNFFSTSCIICMIQAFQVQRQEATQNRLVAIIWALSQMPSLFINIFFARGKTGSYVMWICGLKLMLAAFQIIMPLYMMRVYKTPCRSLNKFGSGRLIIHWIPYQSLSNSFIGNVVPCGCCRKT